MEHKLPIIRENVCFLGRGGMLVLGPAYSREVVCSTVCALRFEYLYAYAMHIHTLSKCFLHNNCFQIFHVIHMVKVSRSCDFYKMSLHFSFIANGKCVFWLLCLAGMFLKGILYRCNSLFLFSENNEKKGKIIGFLLRKKGKFWKPWPKTKQNKTIYPDLN